MKQISFVCTEEEHRQIKSHAALRGIPIKELILESLKKNKAIKKENEELI